VRTYILTSMVSGKRRKAADIRRMLVDAAIFDFGEAGITATGGLHIGFDASTIASV